MKTTTRIQLFAYVMLLISCVVGSAFACEAGHSVRSVDGDGKIVILEDGSVWEIDDGDTADTATWTTGTEIVVCDDKLINTDDDETVDATKIH